MTDIEDWGKRPDWDESDPWGAGGDAYVPYTPDYDLTKDKKLHLLAMWILGFVAVGGLLGIVLLQFCDKEIPDVLSVVIGSSVTAIAALFKVR